MKLNRNRATQDRILAGMYKSLDPDNNRFNGVSPLNNSSLRKRKLRHQSMAHSIASREPIPKLVIQEDIVLPKIYRR